MFGLPGSSMLSRHPVLKFLTILGGLFLAFVLFLFFFFHVDHTLVTFNLPRGYELCMTQDRELDVADSVFCRLDGPKVSHSSQFVAAIGAGTSVPRFTLHSTPNAQVFWITADTLPHTILYIVDFESRSFWPGCESGEPAAVRDHLLALANSVESGYRLNNHATWIGIKK